MKVTVAGVTTHHVMGGLEGGGGISEGVNLITEIVHISIY